MKNLLLSLWRRLKFWQNPEPPMAATATSELTIRARVFRAATGKWEDHGVVAKATRRIGPWQPS